MALTESGIIHLSVSADIENDLAPLPDAKCPRAGPLPNSIPQKLGLLLCLGTGSIVAMPLAGALTAKLGC